MAEAPEDRRVAAILAFLHAALLGYALLRLQSFLHGEPDPRSVGPSQHIPFFWRSATALWWGAMAAAAGWRWPQSRDALGRALPWVVALVVGLAVAVP